VLPDRIDTLVGSMLGKDYRVIQQIGAGGMAVVYLVEHQTLLKRFAAKVLLSDLASSLEARARFTQEAHAASQLDHENIVSISDFGVTEDHRPFFVMELLRGQTLDQRLTEGAMALEEVVAVAVPVARALAHAHAEGIVHRDIKPENIFLVQRSQGRWGVKVVDFGIAKTPINPKLTKMGETLGSPLFMAPEMIRGEDDVDQRADVYSFGVLLYLMLCGRLPFFDDNLLKVMQMHLTVPVPPPRTVNPVLSAALAAVVERALAKRADDRYPGMAALLLDLEAALPPGADRLLIEAQSGTAVHGTPFAGTLAMARPDAQRQVRGGPSEPAQRTMRVAPLPSPIDEPRAATAHAYSPRRILIVGASALVSGFLGVLLWSQITGHRTRPSAVEVAAAPNPAAVIAGAAPATAPGSTAPALAAATPAAPVAVTSDSAPSGASPGATTGTVSAAPAAAGSAPGARPTGSRAPAAATGPGDPAGLAGKRPVVRPKLGVRRDVPRVAAALAVETSAPRAAGSAELVPASEPASPSGGATTATPAPAASAAAPPGAAAPSHPTEQAAAAPPPVAPVPSAAPAVAAGPGSLDATPAIASLEVKGSLAPSSVRRAVERLLGPLRACYRSAARAGNATPAVDLELSFEIDENGLPTHVASHGAGFGSLARCATEVVGQLRTPVAPDVGTVQAQVLIRFRPS